jgi:iron(III) transport system ATP-binding protein
MIEVENLSLTYHSASGSHLAVNDISFRVERGQFYTLLGPSGCGKTTTLRSVAGLERPDAGEIRIDGVPVSSAEKGIWVPPNRREIGMVFQSYAIWPHMTVFENAAFPLRYGEKRIAAAEIGARVDKVLRLVQLDHLADRPAPNLSGGQQQRLALARAFVMEPKVLLLDEPLSNLDAKLREDMRSELRQLVKATGVTTIFVTHEQIEALTLSDVIAVMNEGRIAQEGPPLDIYRQPDSAFVADFIGHSNLVPGTALRAPVGVSGTKMQMQVQCTLGNLVWGTLRRAPGGVSGSTIQVQCALGNLVCTATSETGDGEKVMLAIRPEHIELMPQGDADENQLQGVLETASFIGNVMECSVRIGEQSIKVQLHPDRTPPLGSTLAMYVAPRHCLALRA